jgi:large repetitive protein
VYGYDAYGRLASATSADRPALDAAAAYDADGNLTSLAQAGMSRAYAYAGNTNKLASVTPAGGPAQPYAHDAVGAVTDSGDTTLVRDPATGQARRATKAGQTVTTLRDGRGRAVLITTGTGTTATRRLTLRDGSGTPLIEHEIKGTGAASLTAAQIHGPTGRIVLWIDGALYVVSRDLRRSTRFLYAGTAKVAAWLSYCAYGVVDATATFIPDALTAAMRWRFTGQEWVEPLGLYDYGARLYDPALGRFLSPDPADQTPSPYMYVAGDPVGNVDPDGAAQLNAMIFYHTVVKKVLGETKEVTKSTLYLIKRIPESTKVEVVASTKLRQITWTDDPHLLMKRFDAAIREMSDEFTAQWVREYLGPRANRLYVALPDRYGISMARRRSLIPIKVRPFSVF